MMTKDGPPRPPAQQAGRKQQGCGDPVLCSCSQHPTASGNRCTASGFTQRGVKRWAMPRCPQPAALRSRKFCFPVARSHVPSTPGPPRCYTPGTAALSYLESSNISSWLGGEFPPFPPAAAECQPPLRSGRPPLRGEPASCKAELLQQGLGSDTRSSALHGPLTLPRGPETHHFTVPPRSALICPQLSLQVLEFHVTPPLGIPNSPPSWSPRASLTSLQDTTAILWPLNKVRFEMTSIDLFKKKKQNND